VVEHEGLSGSVRELVGRLDRAVGLSDVRDVTERVKRELQGLCRSTATELPPRFREARPDCYARRLLHRDADRGYSVVVMTWGPGQGTELHDHAGMWCVECVLQGELNVTQFDLLEAAEDRFRFEQRVSVSAGVGDAGCLIPPHEYHVLTNRLQDDTTITLHVYGGEMDHCNLFLPQSGGWWARSQRRLDYHH
jgi:predicted metal-dependent enzyme (double-stranded beta helix superfamily)